MDVLRLVKKAKKGDKDALLQLIMTEKDSYYRLAFTYMGNKDDSLDAIEDMIVKLYENIGQLKKATAFYSWSKTILVNGCKATLKKQQKLVLVDDWNSHPLIEDKSSSIYKSEQQIDIQQILAQINTHQAEAIKLKYYHDLDYQSIAAITNVSIGTVKSRIFQGLKKMNQKYGGGRDE